MKPLLALVLLSLPLLAGGCIAIGNRGNPNVTPTVGQQLMDLQKAKESGAMSETEYQTERAKVLGKDNNPK
jgi:hypothetical protein